MEYVRAVDVNVDAVDFFRVDVSADNVSLIDDHACLTGIGKFPCDYASEKPRAYY